MPIQRIHATLVNRLGRAVSATNTGGRFYPVTTDHSPEQPLSTVAGPEGG
jgi:hypothetical protein